MFPHAHGRPGTANPLDLLPAEVPPCRPMRRHGACTPQDAVLSSLSASALAADVAADLAGMWPLTRPDVATAEPQRRMRAASGDSVAGRDGRRMKSLLTDLEHEPLPPPPVPVFTRARASDYAHNKALCGSVNSDLVAQPLYDVRPGTEPQPLVRHDVRRAVM